jgi:hypothetical protein
MAISITHTFFNPVVDEGDPNEVGPNEWNAAHTLGGFGAGVETALGNAVDAAGGLATVTGLTTVYQPLDAGLTDIAGLAVTDGNIIVGDGANWVAESGATARTSLGLGTGNSPQFTAIELSHASQNTLTASAGDLSIEGNVVYRAGGTDVPVADGGTGVSTVTGLLRGNGTSAFTGIADSSTVGQVLRVTGASEYNFGALDLADTDAVTGTLPAGNGGTGITALGTGVATALGVNVGSAGAFVTFNGAGGTPSSLTLTNATGLTSGGVAAATLVTAADTVVGNDNDTTWPTTAAIIDYSQPLDSDLTSWAGVTRAAGFDTFVATPNTANFLSLVTDETFVMDADIGSTVQAFDADLTTLATAFTTASASGAASLAFHEDTDNGTNRVLLQGPASTADVTLTLPAATDTLVGKATTDVFTNKTFDANGSGNVLSNVEVADLAASAVTTAADTIAGNDSDTQLPTSAAVIDYAQPLDADLTAIAALTTTAAGRSALTITDPNADRILAWDDTGGTVSPIALADLTDEATPASGDYVLIYGAEGDLRKANWTTLPGAAGGISNVVEDLTPQLGGDLDANGFDIQFDDATGIRDDSDNELLLFDKTASAVNFLRIENSATGTYPAIYTDGSDADIRLEFRPKNEEYVDFYARGFQVRYSSGAPNFSIIRNGATASGNDVGYLTFYGFNSASAVVYYSYLAGVAVDNTAGSIDGGVDLYNKINNSDVKVMRIAQGMQIGAAPTGGDKGTGTINVASDYYVNDRAVTPRLAHFWVIWTGNSTTILASHNMDSIADTGPGVADGTITTDFSSANWAGWVDIDDDSTAWDATNTTAAGFISRAAGTFQVGSSQMTDGGTAAAALNDPSQWMAGGFGTSA